MTKNDKNSNLFSILYLRTFLTVMVGMFTFGFIDNFILVLAGEAIDRHIADVFGFSTMFSAGIGNTIIYIVSFIYFSFILFYYKFNNSFFYIKPNKVIA